MSSDQMMASKIMKLDQVCQDIVGILRNNPQCLDGNARKGEILETLIIHLDAKLGTRTRDAKPNRASVIKLAILLEGYEDDVNNAKENVWKIIEYLFNISAQELEYIPEDLKSMAFDICMNELREMMH